MKKIIALFCALVLVAGLVACGQDNGNSGAPASGTSSAAGGTQPSSSSPPATDFKDGLVIGYNNFALGSYAHDVMQNVASEVFTSAGGGELLVFNNEASFEKVINCIDNMISADVDGVMWWGVMDTNFAVGPASLNNAGIPFALYDTLPADTALQDEIRNMEYFAGGIATDNYECGATLARFALESGNRTAIVSGTEIGSTVNDARVNGFTETFEAGGGTILATSRVNTAANAHIEALQNMIATHPDVDCVFGGTSDYALAAANLIDPSECDIYTVDLTPEILNRLKDGTLAAVVGAHWVDAMFSAILLQNKIDGFAMLAEDGLPILSRDVPMVILPAAAADLYSRFWVDEYPYTPEDYRHLLYRYNPDVTTEDFLEAVRSYSVENVLLNRYANGEVTKEEMIAAGFDVD